MEDITAQAQDLWCYTLSLIGVFAPCVNLGFLSKSNNDDRKPHSVGQYCY